jgi:hypothetical protein
MIEGPQSLKSGKKTRNVVLTGDAKLVTYTVPAYHFAFTKMT